MNRAYLFVTRPLTLGVRAFVIDAEERVLLVRHTYMKGWYLPGGGVERGETIEAAAIRELREEVGVIPAPPMHLFGIYTNFTEYKSDHVVVFHVPHWDQESCLSREIAEHRFFSIADIPSNTSPGTLRRLSEFGGGARSERW